jgi:hypothetical protein
MCSCIFFFHFASLSNRSSTSSIARTYHAHDLGLHGPSAQMENRRDQRCLIAKSATALVVMFGIPLLRM